MLPIPLKSSTGVNFNPLRVYVSNEYSKDEAEAAEGDFKALDRMRTMAMQARAATDTSVATLQAYYAQVNRLHGIFPINTDHIRIAFTWHDAFRPTKKSTEMDLNFERAGVLFNIGAVKSNIAASADRTSAEGMKLACREFQLAAGLFKHLRCHVVSQLNCSLPSELTEEGLLMVENIMLAQAQACFYEKSVVDHRSASSSMKASVVARLAAQAAEMYSTALKYGESPAMEAAGLDRSWPITLRFQQDFYSAAAQYYQAEACKEAAQENGSGYGEEVTRLRMAQTYIEVVLETAARQRMGPAIIGKAELLKAKIVKNKAVAEKDNSTIYLETVPTEASLKPVNKTCMVKVVEPEPSFPSTGTLQPTLFANILPKAIKEALTEAEKQVVALAAAMEQEGREASKGARQQLARAGLPGSLQAHESPAGLPEATWKKLQGLREKQSTVSDLQAQAEELQKTSGQVAGTFLKIEKMLKEEEVREIAFRAKYGPAWDKFGEPSAQLMATTWKEVSHFQTLFAAAQRSDDYLISRLRSPELDGLSALLDESRRNLDARLAQPSSESSPVLVDSSNLSAAMLRLARLLDERDALLVRIKAEPDAMYVRLKGRLLAGELVNEAVPPAMASVGELKSALAASIAGQGPLVEEILSENERFQAGRKTDPALLERDALVQQLETGVLQCHELHAQLAEGREFYASVSKRIQQLLLVTEDQLYTQDIQRRDFEVELGQSANRKKQESDDQDVARKLFEQLNVQQQQEGEGAATTGDAPHFVPQPPFGGGGPSPSVPPPPPAIKPLPPPPHSLSTPTPGPPPSYEQAQALPIAPAYTEQVKISQLVQMGFPKAQAQHALVQERGDLQAALNVLLSG